MTLRIWVSRVKQVEHVNVEVPDNALEVFNALRKEEPWRGFMCAVMRMGAADRDGYEVHFHSWGRLRPWRRQIILDAYGLNRMCVIRPEHVGTLLANKPTTFYDAMRYLRWYHSSYNFTFLDRRHG